MTDTHEINSRHTKINTADKQHHIHPATLFHIALKNFVSRKLRSFLTVFGVVIGVTAVSFLLSFGMGIQELVTTQVIGDQSLKSIDISSPNSKILSLNETTLNEIKTYAHVQNVGAEYSFPGIASVKGGEVDTVVYGVDQVFQDLSSLVMSAGRLIENEDAKAAVISSALLESLAISDPKEALGKELSVTVPLEKFGAKSKSVSGSFIIVGVVNASSGNEIYLPASLFDIAGVPSYNQAKIVVDDIAYVDSVRAQIEARGFETTSLTDTLTEINNIFQFFNVVLVGLGSIGMIVAILGMFNTMTISLLERTREIGLMMALGSRRRDMKKLFTLEAVIISFLGAIVGLTLSYLISRIVNLALNLSAQSRGVNDWFELFSYPPLVMLAIILSTVTVGLLVVYLPAKRAERINPIDALRRE